MFIVNVRVSEIDSMLSGAWYYGFTTFMFIAMFKFDSDES